MRPSRGAVGRLLGAPAVCAVLLCLAQPARADVEGWSQLEARVPLAPATEGGRRIDLRVLTDWRFNLRSEGLDLAFLRVGPLFRLAPWLDVAVHGTAIADQLPDRRFTHEWRLEVEPTFRLDLGAVLLSDRNRLELRARDDRLLPRYRNMLRADLRLQGWPVAPFAADEVMIDLSRDGLHQNRLYAGVARPFPGGRVDVAYLFRSRRDLAGAFDHDHALVVYVFVDLPSVAR